MLAENDRLPNLVRLVFTRDEYETIKKIINEYGNIEQTVTYAKQEALREQFEEFDKADLDEED